MTEQELRAALARSLTDEMPAETRTAVMNKIKGRKEPIVKSKMSVALVLALVLTLLSTVAIAYTLSREYFEDVAVLQFESGYYEDWGLAEKQAMVAILEEHGLINAEQADKMTDEASIDTYMIERYGVEGSDRMDTIGLYSILEKELGLIETWSLEQRAWYSDVMMQTGLLRKGGEEGIFGIPGENDIQPDEAVAIAKAAIIEAFGLSENALDNHRVDLSFETDSTDWERQNLYYLISFRGKKYDDFYWCNVTRDGRIMDSTMDKYSCSPAEQVEQKRKEAESAKAYEITLPQGASEQWSLADKVQFLGGDNGLPGAEDITEEEAITIALTRFASIGYDLHSYSTSVWYKLYDAFVEPTAPSPDEMNPFYVIYFSDDLEAPTKIFSIIIDADTGDILQEAAPAPSNG